MRTQTVAVVNGTPDVMASLESLFEGGRYDVVFPGLSDAYADIRRLRPERVVLVGLELTSRTSADTPRVHAEESMEELVTLARSAGGEIVDRDGDLPIRWILWAGDGSEKERQDEEFYDARHERVLF